MSDAQVDRELGAHTHADEQPETVDDLAGLIPPAHQDGPATTVDDLAGLIAPEPSAAAMQNADLAEAIGGHRGQPKFAHMLAQTYGGELLHVHGIGWHVWDGTRWALDETSAAWRRVNLILRRERMRAFGDKDATREVSTCESANGVAGILRHAESIAPLYATVRDLDANPYLLNVANGTLDLETLQLRTHDPADRITRVATAAYRPGARSGRWESFLARVLPDDDVRGFVQRYAGVALVGTVLEHMLAIFTGTGRNGKGVFYGAMSATLGDYATTAEPDLFMHRENAHPTGEMDLRGARWVVVSESDEGRKLAAATMKRLTGGDRIRARKMRENFVEFEASHTPVLVTNHLPKVRGDDPAIWARLRVVPFDVVIPPDEQDKRLGEKLATDRDAILTWAVQGWASYQAHGGLAEPAAVLAATERYKLDSDAVARFIDDVCLVGPNFTAQNGPLWDAWCAWARADGTDPGSQRAFGKALDTHGYDAGRTKSGRFRRGIALQGEDEQPRRDLE